MKVKKSHAIVTVGPYCSMEVDDEAVLNEV